MRLTVVRSMASLRGSWLQRPGDTAKRLGARIRLRMDNTRDSILLGAPLRGLLSDSVTSCRQTLAAVENQLVKTCRLPYAMEVSA